jgi:inorganic pyrophosphatase
MASANDDDTTANVRRVMRDMAGSPVTSFAHDLRRNAAGSPLGEEPFGARYTAVAGQRRAHAYRGHCPRHQPAARLNVIIEVPLGGQPIKYELDKDAGTLVVNRFLYTSMAFPGNYGFVPHTQSADGEPIDVLVCNTRPLLPGCVINVRPIGILVMEDNLGVDEKIIAVPSPHLTRRYDGVTNYSDVPTITLQQIEHFFEHYKDLEEGKWVKIGDWGDAAAARRAIGEAIARAAHA